MDIKQKLKDTLKSAKFGGIAVHVNATKDSKLEVEVVTKGVIDLPGDLDHIVAQITDLLGLGNSKESLSSSSD